MRNRAAAVRGVAGRDRGIYQTSVSGCGRPHDTFPDDAPSTRAAMTQTRLFDQNEEAAAAVRKLWSGSPRVGIILGTGLGKLAEEVENATTIPYEQIPHMPRSTAPTHKGQLVCGTLAGKSVVV